MSELRDQKFEDLTVRIDRGKCISSANCVAVGGEVFEIGDKGIVTFREDAEEIHRDDLLEACRVCPVEALIVLDGDGGQIVPG